MAGASVALGGLQNLAMASSRPTGAADLQAGLSGEPQSGAEYSTNAPATCTPAGSGQSR
jgi:hypothetical protein